jgi:uncharacterized protein (DUF885 family)
LKSLREHVESELGDRFDVRRFHDALLMDGGLPLYLLDININVWLAGQKAQAR